MTKQEFMDHLENVVWRDTDKALEGEKNNTMLTIKLEGKEIDIPYNHETFNTVLELININEEE